MFRTLAIAALAAFVVVAPAAAQPRGDARFNALADEYERIDRRFDPITSGEEGDRAALSLLPDVTPAATEAQRTALANLRARLGQINTRQLSAEAALNHNLLTRTIDDQLESIGFDRARLNVGALQQLDALGRTTPLSSREDAEAWLARLAAAPRYVQDSIANSRRGIASGFVQPRIIVERSIEVTRLQVNGTPENSALMIPFAGMPSTIPADAQAQFRARGLALVRDQIKPAQRAMLQFLETELLPASRTTLGARQLPNGEAYYAYLVRSFTTTPMTPDEVHALGQTEVRRIRAQMDAVIREANFRGSFQEFQHFLRTDPQFYATSAEDLMEKTAEITRRADAQLPRLFGTLPRLTYGIEPTPAEIAPTAPTAGYQQGSVTLGKAGTYFVNTYNLNQRPLYELPALTVHEATPGHHTQIALMQEQGEAPYFRRTTYVTAFVEGWGLYAETLGAEMGMYRTPYERFGRLSYEMWRACRLVADTGIHWLGWSFAQARQCFDENTALSPHNITAEVTRYVSNPGQALAYKIGELTFLRLRREAETTLGERFNVREFHDVLLGAGSLPMPVVEERMRAWVASKQRG